MLRRARPSMFRRGSCSSYSIHCIHLYAGHELQTEEISHNALTCAYYRGNIFAYDGTPESDSIFSAQSSVITSLADTGDCVIVGRCADAVLKSKYDCFNVFIHAPVESRKKNELPNNTVSKPTTQKASSIV